MRDVRELFTALKLRFGVDEIEDELAIRLAETVLEVVGWGEIDMVSQRLEDGNKWLRV